MPGPLRRVGRVQIVGQGWENRGKDQPFGIVLLPNEGHFPGKRPIRSEEMSNIFVNSSIKFLRSIKEYKKENEQSVHPSVWSASSELH